MAKAGGVIVLATLAFAYIGARGGETLLGFPLCAGGIFAFLTVPYPQVGALCYVAITAMGLSFFGGCLLGAIISDCLEDSAEY